MSGLFRIDRTGTRCYLQHVGRLETGDWAFPFAFFLFPCLTGEAKMMRTALCVLMVFCMVGMWVSVSYGVERAPRISDREIIESLAELKAGQKLMDQRFEQMDQRFEGIEQRLDRMVGLFLGTVGAFAAIVASTIGFAIWDRRTTLRPVLE